MSSFELFFLSSDLTWLFYYLSQHEEMEKRVLQELKDVLQGGVATAENSQDLM